MFKFVAEYRRYNLYSNGTDRLEIYKFKKGCSLNGEYLEIIPKIMTPEQQIESLIDEIQAKDKELAELKQQLEKRDERRCNKIPQIFYGRLEIDTRENDVVIVAMVEKTETNLIQIERGNIKKLINILKKESLTNRV